ncbi:unnamed protein product [Lepidochelys olivacea]
MAGGSGTLTWLQKARNHIENSQEWRDFTVQLCDAAQQQMTESHVHFFTDLSAAEKAFVLQRAAKAIQGGDLCKALMSQVSTCLEEQLYIQVAHELQAGDRLKNKSALVLSHIKNGVMNLLEERPAMKGKLQAFFNQSLPADLRRLTGRLHLSNTEARMEYLSQVAVNKAKSPKEREIFLRSQVLLSTEPTFQHLKNNKAEEPQEPLQKALQHMVQPAISTVFAGYLTMGTLLYVWDQVIIGLDQPAYNCLPAFSTAFILLLRDYLKTCQSPGQVETALRTQGPILSVQEFQDVIRKHVFRELSSQLHRDDSDPFPVHDPTQVLPPWNYLYRLPVSPRTRPQDRRQAREECEMFQRQHMERLKQEERLQRFREEEQKRLSIDAYSEGSLTAPAPSLQSLTPSQTLHPQPSPVQTPPPTVTDGTNRTREIHGKTAKTITLDLLEQLMQAANTIANGSNAAEHDSLNAATKEHFWNYNQDCKNAEIEVFGHQINTEDREKIPEPKRQLREKLTTAISRNAEARYKAQFEAVRMLSEPDYMV